jgi:hypothetical protein
MNTDHLNNIRVKVFFLIRYHDVELAESFLRHCPEANDLEDINAFFHRTLAQLHVDTSAQRSALETNLTEEQWLQRFEQHVLPLLREYRFPPLSGKNVPSLYSHD